MREVNILYVEDELLLAKVIIDGLEDQNFNVKWSNDGLTAYHLFKSGHYDICLIDIMVPKLDGISLVKKIRETDSTIPIIFLSARTLTEDVVRGFEVGGNDYLKKPFAIEELIVRITSLLKRNSHRDMSTTTPVAVERLGAYHFDYENMLLKHNGNILKLTHTENEILRMLSLKRNQVVERNDILQSIWGNTDNYNARSMDVFISKLRKYLTHDQSIEIINVRAIGYKLKITHSLNEN
ncbi:response regulator transcription factor [Pedobacter sp. AW31-3R]|uniref:response regulator transcription factor n=1 Tax=Pedobacter sp. AW31-3R TaxID=3445781 RepID=UPI003FA10130